MPRTYRKRIGCRKYINYSDEKLEQCLQAIRSGKITQRKAEQRFKIPRRTIINKLNNHHPNKPGSVPIFSEEEEAAFVRCLQTFNNFGFPIYMSDLRMFVKSYLLRIGRVVKKFNNNIPGHDWTVGFLKRHPEISFQYSRNTKRVKNELNEQVLCNYISVLANVVKDVSPHNIWNFSEFSFNTSLGQTNVFKRNKKYPTKCRSPPKLSISLMFAGNAAGALLPPYVVYPTALQSDWIENGPKGCRYNTNSFGWFDSAIFCDWFENLLLPVLNTSSDKKVIICDNSSSHLTMHIFNLCKSNNITLICLPPDTTHLTQPIEVGFSDLMSATWEDILTTYNESVQGEKNTLAEKSYFPILLGKLVDVLELDSENILIASFKRCGIHPINVNELLCRIPKFICDKDAIENTFLESLDYINSQLKEGIVVKRGRKRLVIRSEFENADFEHLDIKKEEPEEPSDDNEFNDESQETVNELLQLEDNELLILMVK